MASEYEKALYLQEMYEDGRIPAHKAKREALEEKIKKLDPDLKKNPDKILKPGSIHKEGGKIPSVNAKDRMKKYR